MMRKGAAGGRSKSKTEDKSDSDSDDGGLGRQVLGAKKKRKPGFIM